jgi:hypothetical protein
MLCYRGVRYFPTGHLYQTIPGEVMGRYRGAEVRSRKLITPVYQPSHLLTYRGVHYFTHDNQVV